LPKYASILLAVDSSDHSNRATQETLALAAHYGSKLAAAHVYAAKLHDDRFRQMEGGLPEQFREEQELERQRDVHDDLITRGLSIITDSYLDQVDAAAKEYNITVTRRSLEGKNYRELTTETNSGEYDLLVMGSLGLGAVKGSRLGTVCQRVARRSRIDTLVIKEPTGTISAGPIVVAVDGSPKSYGGLLTAISLAGIWNREIKVVAAFDPYYHYVAFNRIAGVLSEEAGQVFKFQEQEKLHEEIIDSGLAKIYQGHLSVAQSIADDYATEVETVLLDGKPHAAIARYLQQVKPSLLVIGTTGIHADQGLDIGGNSEHLLNDAECAVLLSQREHQPNVDRLASVTTSWTNEAEARMDKVPSFVRPMAKMAILRYAQEKGHTVITEGIVDAATAELMPGHAEKAMQEIVDAHDRGKLKSQADAEQVMRWSDAATGMLLTVQDLSLRGNLSLRAEKKARSVGSHTVEYEHIRSFVDEAPGPRTKGQGNKTPRPDSGLSPALGPDPSTLHWQAAALARLMRVPEGFMRESSRQRIETYALKHGHEKITLEIAESGLAEARQAMAAAMEQQDPNSETPEREDHHHTAEAANITWSSGADSIVSRVPAGVSREMTRKAAEAIATQRGMTTINAAFIAEVMQTFQAGSEESSETMPWEESAREGIARAPDMVRGMLIREIEGWAQRNSMEKITLEAVAAVKEIWSERGVFHLNPGDPRNS